MTADSFSAADYRYMARALQLAQQGWFSTRPNPRVGCVIVKHGRIIGEGFHYRAGEPHAERVALSACSESPQNATVYVTLEPCCHHGRTPPCSQALIEAAVGEVVVAMVDPNPLVAEKGLQQLRQAGIKTRVGLLEPQARQLNRGFISRMARQRPFVRAKLAASTDGHTAMASGESVWITSDQARQDVQRLRAESCAIMTGSATVMQDNPSMNVRLQAAELGLPSELPVMQPLRVVLDTHLRTRPDSKIYQLPGEVIVFCSEQAMPAAERFRNDQVRVIPTAMTGAGLDLQQILSQLAALQVNEVLLETGATLAGQAVAAGLVDELVIYQAPHLMGSSARPLLVMPAIEQMAQRRQLHSIDCRHVGADLKMTYRLDDRA